MKDTKELFRSIISGLVVGIVVLVLGQVIQFDQNTSFGIPVIYFEKDDQTLARVNIENAGSITATNLHIIVNPGFNINSTYPTVQMEEFSMRENGERSLIIDAPRLASGAKIGFDLILDGKKDKLNYFMVFLSSDQGSKIYDLADEKLIWLKILVAGVAGGTVGLSIYSILVKKSRK